MNPWAPRGILAALLAIAACHGGTDTGELPADADGDGHVGEADCDEGDATRFVGAPETCDGIDQDCDGVVDEDDATDAPTWYGDGDGDGYGQWDAPRRACALPAGHADNPDDCDDDDPTRSPGTAETCNGRDDDCDGITDPASAVDAARWYPDADGDGWGSDAAAAVACTAPPGFVSEAGDCDDADPAVSPDGVETCDGVDQDCDGVIDPDDALDAGFWYADADGDGAGDPGDAVVACEGDGRSPTGDDCDDADPDVYPGAPESPDDGVDQDCYDGDLECADAELEDALGRSLGAGEAGADARAASCGVEGAPERAWHWAAPADGRYFFSAEGRPVAVYAEGCDGEELACDPGDGLTIELAAGEERVIVAEGEGEVALTVDRVDEVDCADGADGDDGLTDCLDPECDALAACDASLADLDLGSATGVAVASGTTEGMGNDWRASCGGGAEEDVALAWVAPAAGAWTVSLAGSGYDTVLAVFSPDGRAQYDCANDVHGKAAALTLDARAGERFLLVVDGKEDAGSWVLGIYSSSSSQALVYPPISAVASM